MSRPTAPVTAGVAAPKAAPSPTCFAFSVAKAPPLVTGAMAAEVPPNPAETAARPASDAAAGARMASAAFAGLTTFPSKRMPSNPASLPRFA
ncbi:hypothetical protein D9M72_303740 [compost metagenome]